MKALLHSFLNCIFEAQIQDRSFLEQMILALNSQVNLRPLSLSPMDCLSVHYFLSSIRTIARGEIDLSISDCGIDDQGLGILLGISLEGEEATCGVFECLETLQVDYNEYTDTGIAYIARALTSNNTLTGWQC